MGRCGKYDSTKWKVVRRRVLKRDNYTCIQCGCRRKLHCHHTYYTKGKEVWDYPLSCFQTLCEKCHNDFHRSIKGREMTINPNEKTSDERMIDSYVFKLSPKDRILHKKFEEFRNKRL